MPAVSPSSSQIALLVPEFGQAVPHHAEPCTPRELYYGLFVELEDHVHYLEPAYRFAVAAVEQPYQRGAWDSDPQVFIDSLVAEAQRELSTDLQDRTTAQLIALVSEFAPWGLADGAWLRQTLYANGIESEVGMRLLRGLMKRFGGPGVADGYSVRYANLLRSLGVQPTQITQSHAARGAAESELAYEHALLGITLGLFPTALLPEILGFDLWASSVGPCPLLSRLREPLNELGADLRYFELHDFDTLRASARAAVSQLLQDERAAGADLQALQQRVARGFAAAQRSYLRWERKQLGHELAPSLAGLYSAPQDEDALAEFAFAAYGELSKPELFCRFANVDMHPAVRLLAREYAGAVFDHIAHLFETIPELNSQHPPPYSERALAEMVEEQHQKNVRSRGGPKASLLSSNQEDAVKGIQEVFDGSWLQGFMDVHRADFEEYGWLFRIYASEHGDGDFAWNHCQIFRKAFQDLGPNIMLPKTDPRLYELFDVGFAAMVTTGVSLNTRHFMPEVLGINLGIESTGVGGSYIEQWKDAERKGLPWRALAWRLHNSIDNYADGHTKWSVYAINAFMRRVQESSPQSAHEQWVRIWRLWRCRDILAHGTPEEMELIDAHFQADAQIFPEQA